MTQHNKLPQTEKIPWYPTLKQLLLTFGLWIIFSFVFRFFAFNLFFYNVLLNFVKSYIEFFANIFGVIYNDFTTTENLISLNGASLKIIYECTAYSYYLFIIALVIFSPWKWTQKLIHGSILVVTITLLNAARFFSVAWIIRKHPQQLTLFHDYVWNFLFAAIVFIVYFIIHYYIVKNNYYKANNIR